MAAIAGLLAGWALSDLNKVIVFFASRESVEYHYEILSWLAGQKNDERAVVETKGTGTILVLIVVVVAAAAAKAIRTMKRIIIIVKRVEENPRAAASRSSVYTARKSNLSVKRPSPGSNRKQEVFSCAPMLVLAG